MIDPDDKAEVIAATTETLEFVRDLTSELGEPDAACSFILAVATVAASYGNTTKKEFMELMASVWDRMASTDSRVLN